MTTRELIELAQLDALGLLDDQERQDFDRAFAAAPESIRAQLRREQTRLARTDWVPIDGEPPAELRDAVLSDVAAAALKDRVLSAVRREMGAPAHRHQGGRAHPPIHQARVVSRVWRVGAIGAAAAAVALAATTLFLQSQYATLESEMRKTQTYDSITSTRGFNLQDLVFNDNSRLVHFDVADKPGFEGTATAFVDASSQKVRVFYKNFAKDLTQYRVVALDERGEEIGQVTQFSTDKKVDYAEFSVDLTTTKRLAIKEITPDHPEGVIVLASMPLIG
ncbi:MAG: hypothetical protein JNL50_06605 [Phycisphaerae bacterium]|nr:hypothetical protein [Phycisphaerae bacterium]